MENGVIWGNSGHSLECKQFLLSLRTTSLRPADCYREYVWEIQLYPGLAHAPPSECLVAPLGVMGPPVEKHCPSCTR